MSALRWISEGRTIRSARSSTPRTTPSVVNIYTATFTVSQQILNGRSAQLGYTVTFMSVHAGKYGTANTSKTDTTKTKHNPDKANKTKHSKTKLAWFSRVLRHSARKRGWLILQCSRAHTGPQWYYQRAVVAIFSLTCDQIRAQMWSNGVSWVAHTLSVMLSPRGHFVLSLKDLASALKLWPQSRCLIM